jgi:hypothetical protein
MRRRGRGVKINMRPYSEPRESIYTPIVVVDLRLRISGGRSRNLKGRSMIGASLSSCADASTFMITVGPLDHGMDSRGISGRYWKEEEQ